MEDNAYVPLNGDNVEDIICCPGGTEVKNKAFKGDISPVLRWKRDMVSMGMEGVIQYCNDVPVGFAEYMPTDKAPMPLEGSGTCTLICFHWKNCDDRKHLDMELELLRHTIEMCKGDYEGMAALAWDHPVHFPISMMEKLGFVTLDKQEYIQLMWLPFKDGAEEPGFVDSTYIPVKESSSREVIIEQGYSNRCPYSIHNANRVKGIVEEIGRERVEYHLHTIDTREEAIRFAVSPWSWDWLYVNGKASELFGVSDGELKRLFLE